MIIFFLVSNLVLADKRGRLRFVQAFWRHGDRAPRSLPYPNDKYDIGYWPREWLHLTEVVNVVIFMLTNCFAAWSLSNDRTRRIFSFSLRRYIH